jgi:hypothetical protein
MNSLLLALSSVPASARKTGTIRTEHGAFRNVGSSFRRRPICPLYANILQPRTSNSH